MNFDTNELFDLLIKIYRKFKSYIYYSNGNEYLIEKISDFEYDPNEFDNRLKKLACAIVNNENDYFEMLVEKIWFQLMPKLGKTKESEYRIISNQANDSIEVHRVNFFIDAPIELFIIDTFWSLILGRLIVDNKNNYVFHKAYLFDLYLYDSSKRDILKSINFDSINIFQKYFNNYIVWKNTAVDFAENQYMHNKDSSIISLDLDSYYYKTNIDLKSIISKIELKTIDLFRDYQKYDFLESIVNKIYTKYSSIVGKYRKDVTNNIIVPIGLISSGIISNLYLIDVDKTFDSQPGVLYYSRYVDDILVVLDNVIDEADEFDLSKHFPNVFSLSVDKTKVLFKSKTNISIQNNKIKVINNYSRGPKILLQKLRSQISNSSEPHLLPNIDLSINDFLDKIYQINDDNLKIRETSSRDINPKNFMKFLNAYMIGRKNTIDSDETENQIDIELVDQITKTFTEYRLFELYTRWQKILAFSYLSFENEVLFGSLKQKIYDSITNMKLIYDQNDSYLYLNYRNKLEKLLRKSLIKIITVSENSVYAVYPKEHKNTLWKKIREANMINHKYLSIPLINYFKETKAKNWHSSDYTKISDNVINKELDTRKIKLSPRFIYFSEYVLAQIVVNPKELNKPNNHINHIKNYNKDVVYLLGGEVISENDVKTNENKIVVGDNSFVKNQVIKIGLVNMNLSNHKIIINRMINFNQTSFDRRIELFSLLNSAFIYQKTIKPDILLPNRYHDDMQLKSKANNELKNIDFILFPEVSIPIEWLSEVADFSRKSGIAIIAGIKYLKSGTSVFNTVATLLPYKSILGHNNIFLSLRQKNDYAPEEKELIKDNKLVFHSVDNPIYNIFSYKNIRFSVFNCYELTDIISRATLKNKIDLLFSPQYNKDVNYFSSVIEATSRDLFAYVAQSNSSEYGDTRIVAPYKGFQKNIAVISGGINSLLHIGEIKLFEYDNYLLEENNDAFIKEVKKYKKAIKKVDEKYIKVKRTQLFCSSSARTNKKREHDSIF